MCFKCESQAKGTNATCGNSSAQRTSASTFSTRALMGDFDAAPDYLPTEGALPREDLLEEFNRTPVLRLPQPEHRLLPHRRIGVISSDLNQPRNPFILR